MVYHGHIRRVSGLALLVNEMKLEPETKADEFWGGLLAMFLFIASAPIIAVYIAFNLTRNLYGYIWKEYIWKPSNRKE